MNEPHVSRSVVGPAFVRAIVVVVALNASFLALAVWTAGRPREPLIARVREAFASGELVDRDYLPLDQRRGFHQYNDCLILQMITNRDRHLWLNAIAPVVYVTDLETWERQCATLHRLVDDNPTMSHLVPDRYARYWLGDNTVAAALLPWLSLAHVRRGLKLAVYASLAGLLVAAGARHRRLFAVATAIAVTGASVWAVPYFGQSLNDGPGDILVVLGIGSFLFWRRRLSHPAAFIPFCAAFGAVMVYVEMFTGVTATAAGLLFPLAYVVALSSHHGASVRPGWVFAITGLAAFALGGALTVATKLALSIAFVGQEAAGAFLGHLTLYMSPHLAGGRPSITAPFAALLRQGSVLTYGSEPGALLLYAGTGLTWVTAACLALRRARVRPASDFLAFAVGAASMPLWVVVFPTHTVIHSWLNVRLFFVPVSLGLAALAWQLTVPHGERDGGELDRADRHGAGAVGAPGAVAATREVENNDARHAKAAPAIGEELVDSDTVLPCLNGVARGHDGERSARHG